jgi:polar amino acid transport system permease protein
VAHYFDWTALLNNRDLLLDGLRGTILLFIASLLASCVGGVIVGCLRSTGKPSVAGPLSVYVELFRNIPPVVQLFFWTFAVGLDTFVAAWIGLSVFTSVYISEILRSGIQSIPGTQLEAARSTGLPARYLWTHIILPQALIKTIPALSVEFITLLKNTSIAMTIGYIELTFATQEIEARTFRGFTAASLVTLIYIFLCLAIVLAMYGVERLAQAKVRSF